MICHTGNRALKDSISIKVLLIVGAMIITHVRQTSGLTLFCSSVVVVRRNCATRTCTSKEPYL